MRPDEPGLGLLRRDSRRETKSSSSAPRSDFSATAGRSSKKLGARRFWRVPVMDGEFVCESTAFMTKGAVGGGNLIIMGATSDKTLAAAEAAVEAMRAVPDVIMPFPGGIVRSGSKVGSKYKGASASTNDAYCPDLERRGRDRARSRDRLRSGNRHRRPDERAVAAAMGAGLAAIAALGPRTRRPAHRRGQLRRQVRPTSFSPSGATAVRRAHASSFARLQRNGSIFRR